MRINYVLLLCYEKKRASSQIPSWNGFPNARKDATHCCMYRAIVMKSRGKQTKMRAFFMSNSTRVQLGFNGVGTCTALLRILDLDASQFIYLLKLRI